MVLAQTVLAKFTLINTVGMPLTRQITVLRKQQLHPLMIHAEAFKIRRTSTF